VGLEEQTIERLPVESGAAMVLCKVCAADSVPLDDAEAEAGEGI